MNDPDNLPPRLCLVLDDISALKRDALVAHIFSRYRHYNLTIFLSNQTIKTLPTVCRSMATAVFLSSCYSTVEREKILDEWAEFYGGKDKMVAIWDDAVQERFNAFRSRTSVQTSLNEMRCRCCFAHKLKKKLLVCCQKNRQSQYN